jgi:virginiamycin B lyase
MRIGALCIAVSFTLFATACGGGGGGGSALPSTTSIAPGQPPTSAQSVHATAELVIPNTPTSSQARPRFVSASTNGVSVTTYAHSDTNHTTPLATVVTDVSSTSSACTPASGAGRTCNVNVQGPVGSDDFVFNLYDAAPVSGAIPNTAHLLGTAGVTSTLTANTANTVNATIGGVITGLSGATPFMSVAADGSTHNIGITITAKDFGNNTITGTGAVGTYANPVTVAVTEHGGTGHATVELNGGTPAASVQASKSSDTVQVVYDGKGSPGYYVTVALGAAAVGTSTAPTPESATIAPLIVSSTSTDYTQASSSVGLHGNADLAPFTVSEAQAGSPTFTFTRGAHCPAIALLQTLSNTTFNILALGDASTYATGTGCAITVSDGTSTLTLGVSNTYTHTCCTPTFTSFNLPTHASYSVGGIAVGADGNMWITDAANFTMNKIATNAANGSTATLVGTLPAASHGTFNSYWSASGPDGNVWFADCSINANVGKVTPSGTFTTVANTGLGSSAGIVTGPDGNIWVTGEAAPPPGNFAKVTTAGGAATPYSTTSTNAGTFGVAEGPDGNLWFTECSGKIAKVSTNGTTLAEYTPPTMTYATSIVAGPDGAMWFVGSGSGIYKVGRVDVTSGIITEHAMLDQAANAFAIVVGSDGKLWYSIDNGSAPTIERMNATTFATTDYAFSNGNNNIWQLTAGPDGGLWWSNCSAGTVGHLTF